MDSETYSDVPYLVPHVASQFMAFRATSDPVAATRLYYNCLALTNTVKEPDSVPPSAAQLRPIIINAREQVTKVVENAPHEEPAYESRGSRGGSRRSSPHARSHRDLTAGDHRAAQAYIRAVRDATIVACNEVIH